MANDNTLAFRSYSAQDREDCLEIFDKNCPTYFALNERNDYLEFLGVSPDEYEVCLHAQSIVGAFGLFRNDKGSGSLHWILIDPNSQGMGIGTAIMNRIVDRGRAAQLETIAIGASHKSAPFFARFGACAGQVTDDGWGPGMHRIDMLLHL